MKSDRRAQLNPRAGATPLRFNLQLLVEAPCTQYSKWLLRSALRALTTKINGIRTVTWTVNASNTRSERTARCSLHTHYAHHGIIAAGSSRRQRHRRRLRITSRTRGVTGYHRRPWRPATFVVAIHSIPGIRVFPQHRPRARAALSRTSLIVPDCADNLTPINAILLPACRRFSVINRPPLREHYLPANHQQGDSSGKNHVVWRHDDARELVHGPFALSDSGYL